MLTSKTRWKIVVLSRNEQLLGILYANKIFVLIESEVKKIVIKTKIRKNIFNRTTQPQ